jgi:predicted PurR-regulated permease PerM
MTLLLTAVLLVPMIGLAASLTDAVMNLVDYIRAHRAIRRPPAGLAEGDPAGGADIDAYVRKLTHSQVEMRKLALQAVEPARKFALGLGGCSARACCRSRWCCSSCSSSTATARASGPARKRRGAPGRRAGGELLELAGNTVKAVMIGIVGTAAAQALVAWSAS